MADEEPRGKGRPQPGSREWAALALLVLPMLTLASDLTVLFLALPTLSTDLDASPSQSLWIVHAYGFLVAASLVTMGRISDRIGPRRLLLVGSAAFGALSVVAALAPDAPTLIATRAALGIAGATLMPSLFSLVRTMFEDEQQRRFAIAVMFSAFSVGGAVGPLLGGGMIEKFWWGSIFLLNVPPMALVLLLGPRLLPERDGRTPVRIDLFSVLLSASALLLLVHGLQELAAEDSDARAAATNLATVAVGVVLLATFVRRQRSARDPLLDPRLLRDRRIVVPLLTLLLVGTGVVGVFYLFTQHLQWVQGLSPLTAGLWTLPYIAVNIAGAMLAPALASRVPPASVVQLGLVVAAVGTAVLLVVLATAAPLPVTMGAVSVVGLGQGAAMALVSDLIISGAPIEVAGSAAAAQEVSGELGAALGVAAGGGVSAFVFRSTMAGELTEPVGEGPGTTIGSVHQAVALAESRPDLRTELLTTIEQALSSGFQAFSALATALLVGAVLVMRAGSTSRRAVPPSATADAPG